MRRASPPQRATVLLVEDDEDIREMAQLMLEQRNVHVLVAQDAASAMIKCRVHQGAIDILLTDLGLPGVSGGELSRSAAAMRPDMEIVYISGIPKEIAVRTGLIRPDARFLAKPFTADVLVGTIGTVLAERAASSSG